MVQKVIHNDLDRHLETVIHEWSNDSVMRLYMTNFKSKREVNPNEWDNKLHLWERVIHEACEYKNTFVVKTSQLRNFMTRESRDENKLHSTEIPLGWSTVISEMQKMTELVELNEFKSLYDDETTQGIGSWLLQNVVVRPAFLFWGSTSKQQQQQQQSNSKVSSPVEDDKTFVVMKILREKMDHLVNTVYRQRVTYLDLFLSPSYIRELHFEGKLPQDHINLILCYVTHEGPGTIVKLNNGAKGLRVYDHMTDRTKNPDVKDKNEGYGESYRGIVQLKETLFTLEKQRKQLHNLIDERMVELRELLANKHRDRAKWVLGRKKLLEEILNKREKYISNVHELLVRIEQASTEQEVTERLYSGSQVLNQLVHELQASNVEQTLDDVAQTLADYRDIQEVIDIGIDQVNAINDSVSEEELAQEFENLKLQVNSTEEAKEPLQTQQEEVNDQTQHTESAVEEPSKQLTLETENAPIAVQEPTVVQSASPKHEKQEESEKKEESAIQPPIQKQETQTTTSTSVLSFPQPSDIPVESLRVIEYELEQLKHENRTKEDLKKLTDHLNLSNKLLKLKLKKYQKSKTISAHTAVLRSKIEECEDRATRMQTEGKSEEGLRLIKYISLMEEELEELEEEKTEERKLIAA